MLHSASRYCRIGVVLVLIAALIQAISCGQGDDPFAPPAKDAKKAPAGPGKGKADWGRGDEVRIPLDHRHPPTFGPLGCPVLVVGPKVWDLKQNKVVQELEDTGELRGLRALSGKGLLFAAGSKSPNQTDTAVTVWSTQTGKKVMDVPGKKEAYVDLLAFSRDKYLLLGGRHNNQIDVWDIDSKEKVKTITVPDRRVEADKLAFTSDGRYFASIMHDKIVVHETSTGRETSVMASPGSAGPAPVEATENFPRPRPAKRPGALDAVFVYAWTSALQFSPDGEELAAFSTHPQPRLLCWNNRGELVMDEPVPMPRLVSHRTTLEWLPDKSGFLINGYLFDREAKRVVVSIRVPFGSDVLPHLLDKDRIVGTFGEDRSQLQTVGIPWARLTASLRQLNEKAPAFLTPLQPISLDVDVTGAGGDVEATRKVLTEALTQRLARDGIKVADKQPTVLRLKLSEEKGETLPIYERQSPFDFQGRDTGRKATEAKGAGVLELVAQGQAAPLWRGHLTASSSRTFFEEITDATIRKSMLQHLTRQLNGLDMPYFIPQSQEYVALPAVIE